MGMPTINVDFKQAASTIQARSERGTLMLILRDTVSGENPVVITEAGEIPAAVSSANTNYIKMALAGNETSPKEVVCYFVAAEEDVSENALAWAKTHKVDWIAMPTAETDNAVSKISAFIISEKAFGNEVKAVLPNCTGDSEYIVNFTTESVTTDGSKYEADTYTTEEFCARIAGIICGTALSHSITYADIDEATDCERLTKQQEEDAVKAGKLIAFYDGSKVKIARGINSLTTFTDDKGEAFSKIKIIEAISTIKNDLKKLIQDNYIGKYANTYSNRCILLTAIQDYFDVLALDGVIRNYEATFDLLEIKKAMKKANIDFSGLTDEEIIAYDFGSAVFFSCTMTMLDAIEDVSISITI